MFLTKHHYAIELAKKGNEVYYLNPPSEVRLNKKVEINKRNICVNLFIIKHFLDFNYKLNFKAKWLFHLLMSFHIKRIEKKINKTIDIIWSFDIGDYYPFKYFNKNSLKIGRAHV